MKTNIPALTFVILALLIGGRLDAGAQAPSASAAPDDSWPFQYQDKDFSDAAWLDLRGLNEKTAGEHGFIRLNAASDGFERGDGAPIRFWGVISNNANGRFTSDELDEHARWLAKMGVNMIRRQAHLISQKPGARPDDVDQDDINEIWRYVAAMKKEGIYTSIINYAPLASYGKADLSGWGIPGYEVNYAQNTRAAKPWGVLYFNQQLQESYKADLKKLYGQVNPYTGLTLAQDPAVLMIQLISEDSLLWYTLNGIRPEQLRELGRQYGDWLRTKYGSLDGALKAWNQETLIQGKDCLIGDDVPNGVLGFYNIWEATHVSSDPGKAARVADQVEFLSWTMHKFNAEMVRYLREDLGCKQMILAGNWRPANSATMLDAERWSYSPGDVIAENHFFGRGVLAKDSWRTAEGDDVASTTAIKLLDLGEPPPFVFKQVAGHATFLTSTGWTFPNLYQSEATFLSAVYGDLTGLAGICWEGFAAQPEYDQTGILQINDKVKWLITWNTARPPFVSTFPAAALLYRKGYVACGAPVVEENRKLADMWERKPPLVTDHGSYAAMTNAMKGGAVDPLAFFVGPVRVKYGADPTQSRVADLSAFIQRDQQLVRSNTGQLEWNYGKGYCQVDAPKAQGVCGFLSQTGKFALSTVAITSTCPYASILVVPLDDKPLASSQKVLIQVGTTARLTGWHSEPTEIKTSGGPISAEHVIALGSAPWRIAATHATVSVANPHLAKATLLDANGMAVRNVPVTCIDGKCQVELPPETMYLVLTAANLNP